MIGKTISYHEILKKLNKVGMDVVHKVEDTKLERSGIWMENESSM